MLQPGILYTKTILKALVGTSSIIKRGWNHTKFLHLRQGLEASRSKGQQNRKPQSAHDDDCERAPNCTTGMEDLDLVTKACVFVLYYVRLFKIPHIPFGEESTLIKSISRLSSGSETGRLESCKCQNCRNCHHWQQRARRASKPTARLRKSLEVVCSGTSQGKRRMDHPSAGMKHLKSPSAGTFLVVQGLRIHLPMQGTRVRSLAQADMQWGN